MLNNGYFLYRNRQTIANKDCKKNLIQFQETSIPKCWGPWNSRFCNSRIFISPKIRELQGLPVLNVKIKLLGMYLYIHRTEFKPFYPMCWLACDLPFGWGWVSAWSSAATWSSACRTEKRARAHVSWTIAVILLLCWAAQRLNWTDWFARIVPHLGSSVVASRWNLAVFCEV